MQKKRGEEHTRRPQPNFNKQKINQTKNKMLEQKYCNQFRYTKKNTIVCIKINLKKKRLCGCCSAVQWVI